MTDPLLDLLDYRRRVNEMYDAVRSLRDRDPRAAHRLWRERRDELFRSHPQSALPESDRAAFRGLPYHEYDPAFAFTAAVRALPHESYDVDTSTGGVIRFVRFGAVDLPIGTLEIMWLDEYSGGVFLPFRDATSGKTTYGGGRYLLDTAKGADLGSSGDALILDFNFAYHPSCVYDPKWTCPLAPLSNRLTTAVEAGELLVNSQQRWTLVATILASAIVFLDSTMVNVALPRIGRELPSSVFGVLEGQSYVSNGYLVTLSALLVLAGALSDYYGRRRMFAVGLVGFLVTSLLCGIAPSMELLIVFRVLQGAAGALLIPGSLSLLTATFSGEAQGRAFGIWAGASAATTILGPFLGGALVDTVSWRVAFLINVPLCVLAVWATLTFVRESRDESATGRFDWLGAIVVAVAVGGLSFGTIYSQQREWRDPVGIAVVLIGVIATVAVPFLMVTRRDPLIPPALFRSRNFTVTNISTFLIYGALYVIGWFLTLFLQGTVGYTAAAAGLGFVPSGLFLVFLSSRFGALAGRYGPRLFMALGPALMCLAVLWYARIPATTEPWVFVFGDARTYFPPSGYLIDLLPGSLLFGFGLSIMVAPLTTALMTSVPVQNAGVGSAVNNAISRVGSPLVGAIIFVALTATFYSSLHARVPSIDVDDPQTRLRISPLNVERPASPSPDDLARITAEREASTEAFHLAMSIAAGLLAAGAITNAVGILDSAAKKAGSGAG